MKLKIKVKSGFGQPAQESKNVVDMLREAIEAENDAATQYEQYARLTTDKQAKKLFLDIAGDEKQHFGQLTNFLEYVDPSFKKRFDDGINENKSLKVEAITPILKQISELQNAEDGDVDVNDTLENNEELELKEVDKNELEDFIDSESNIVASFSYDDIAEDFSKVIQKINSYEATDEVGETYLQKMKKAQNKLESAFNEWLELAERLDKNE